MTKSLFAAQRQNPASPGNPESEGTAKFPGQVTLLEDATVLIRWMAENAPIEISDRAYKWLAYLLVEPPGSGVRASQTPLVSPESKSEPSGQQLKQHGIKQVSGHNKEWMRKAVETFKSVWPNGKWFAGDFTGEDIRLYLSPRIGEPTHPNAWGALIVALVRKELIKHNGNYVTPKDKSSHARQIKQYVRV